MTGRRFMDGATFWQRQPFVSLGQTTPVVAPADAATTPAPAPAQAPAAPACSGWKVGTVLAGAGALFFAAEVVGLTNVLGIRKYVR